MTKRSSELLLTKNRKAWLLESVESEETKVALWLNYSDSELEVIVSDKTKTEITETGVWNEKEFIIMDRIQNEFFPFYDDSEAPRKFAYALQDAYKAYQLAAAVVSGRRAKK